MKKGTTKFLAWALWTIFLALAAFIMLVEHVLVPSIATTPLLVDLAFILAITAMATTGAIVAWRLPRNPIGWLLMATPFTAVTAEAAYIYAQYTVYVRPEALPGGSVAGLVSNTLWGLFLGPMVLLVLLFPSGTLLSARWRWVFWGLVGGLVALMASSSLRPELAFLEPPIKSPIAIAGAEPILDAIEIMALAVIGLLLIAAVVSPVLRFIRSTGEERQQIKWFAYTAGAFAIYFGGSILLEVTGNAPSEAWDSVLFAGSLSLLPMGIAVAILKYRLYDVDLLINRTLVYGVLTALLAGAYFGSVFLLQTAFRAVTGQGSTLALVISTLAIAALFTPLRRRIQNVIDRRFYRRKYDATRTLAAFSAKVTKIPHLDKRKTSLEPDAMRAKMFCCTDKPSPTRCTYYEARLTGVPVRRGEEYDGYDSIVGADDVRRVDARSGFEVVGGAPRGSAGRWSGLDGQPDNHVADTAEPGRR